MLADLQRAAVELCYGGEPSSEQYAAIGDARIFRIYREAVRKRLHGELEVALPRTSALLGAAVLGRLFDRFLREVPPRTRFFHAVVGCFADAALPWMRADDTLPAQAADLCAYEAACWAVGDLSDNPQGEVLEFAFDRRPALSPALRLLALRHPVHASAEAEAEARTAGEHWLCVYRKREEQKARHLLLNATTFALMQRFVAETETVAESVQQVAIAREVVVDQAFLDGLCTVLADFLERGIVLGGR
jgi:hypothetical protein